MFLITFLVILNLFISFFNARSVGRIWAESKALGGFIRLVVWAGAIQSAVGFTYCYSIVLGALLYITGIFPKEVFTFMMSFVYIAIIVPLIGSAIIITIESWIVFFREKSLVNGGITVWNTFATIHDTYHAINSFGTVLKTVSGGFKTIFESNGDDDDIKVKIILLAIFVAIIALGAGIFSTVLIIKKYTSSLPIPEGSCA